MAIQNIPNQPVQFDLERDCSCVEEYIQPFLDGDTFNFQVLTDVGDEEITNGEFTTDLTGWTDSGSGWSWDDGEAVGMGSTLTTNDSPATAGEYVEITVVADLELYDPADNCIILVGSVEVGEITSDGTFVFYYSVPSGGGNQTVSIQAPSSIEVRIDSISLKNVVDSGVYLFEGDCDKTNVNYLISAPTFTNRRNLIYQDIAHPSKQCFRYFVGILDPTELFTDDNGPFDSGAWLSNGSGVVLSPGSMTMDGSVTQEIYQQISVNEGDVFQISFDMNTNDANGVFEYFVGDNSQSISVGIGVSVPIAYVTALETGTVNIGVRLYAGTTNVIIDDSDLIVYEGIWSNTFKQEHCLSCLPLIQGDNSRDWQFGFSFLNGFAFTMRAEASLNRGDYSYRNERAIQFNGSRSNTFIERTKTKFLDVAPVPEYIHDALTTLLMTSNFTIDGTRYVFESTAYSPEWSSGTCLASVEVPVVPDLQNEKRQC